MHNGAGQSACKVNKSNRRHAVHRRTRGRSARRARGQRMNPLATPGPAPFCERRLNQRILVASDTRIRDSNLVCFKGSLPTSDARRFAMSRFFPIFALLSIPAAALFASGQEPPKDYTATTRESLGIQPATPQKDAKTGFIVA